MKNYFLILFLCFAFNSVKAIESKIIHNIGNEIITNIDIKKENEQIIFQVGAKSFLHSQVRIMVGTLVDIAKGNIKLKTYKTDTLPKITIRNTLDFVDCNINMTPNKPNKSKIFSKQPIKNTLKQTTIDNKYLGQINNEKGDGYIVTNTKAPNTNRQFYTDTEYSGSVNSHNRKSIDKYSFNNASLNINKEIISRGRKPNQSGPKKCIDKSKINRIGFFIL